ncbi:MAG: globin domain-containing protein [Pseudomonadota bacterium]
MPLNDNEVDTLRESFHTIAADAEMFAAAFYAHLFEIAPETKELFRGDMTKQGQKLTSTLGVVVARIHHFDALRPMVADLARRHRTYGVETSHYAAVGDALKFALQRNLGADNEALAVWERTYQLLSDAMIEAAYGDPHPASARTRAA